MLNIYKSPESSSSISEENLLLTVHNGRIGSWNIIKCFLRNDNAATKYNNIVLSVIDASTSGATFQLYPGDFEPTALEWNFVGFNNSITIEDIIGSETYLPFWLRVFYPGETSANLYQEASIKILATEEAI